MEVGWGYRGAAAPWYAGTVVLCGEHARCYRRWRAGVRHKATFGFENVCTKAKNEWQRRFDAAATRLFNTNITLVDWLICAKKITPAHAQIHLGGRAAGGDEDARGLHVQRGHRGDARPRRQERRRTHRLRRCTILNCDKKSIAITRAVSL